MTSLRVWLAGLAARVDRRRKDAALDDEIRAHLEHLEHEHRLRGVSPHAAHEAARRDFGSVALMKDTYRDQRGWPWLDDLQHDMRYAVRTLLRNRAFTIVAVLTLGLGIGAASAIFSVINAVLLRPLPYPDGDRLVRVIMTRPVSMSGTGVPLRIEVGFSAAEIDEFGARSRTLSDVGVVGGQLMALSGHEDAARLQGARISASALRMLGARPLRGRLIDERDEAAAAEPTILVSNTAWQRFFGGDPNILGRSLTFESILGPPRETAYTVVGILPDSFALPYPQTLFWTSFQPPAADRIGGLRSAVIGRLRDGVSLEAASTEMIPFVRQARRGQPGNDETRYELVREQDELVAPIKPALRVLAVAAAFLLLIACINVANLMLARASVRSRETAIRGALGAGRGRVIRLLLTESVTLALAGGMLGVGVAFGGVYLLRTLAAVVPRFDLAVVGPASPQFPRIAEIAVDGSVLAFAFGIAVAAGVTLGLGVAIRQSRAATEHLRGHASMGSGFSRLSGRSLLVTGEIAAAMILLVGGGLLIRSFANLTAVDAGYDPSNVLSFQVSLPVTRYSDDRLRTFAEDLVGRLRLIPGVEQAAYTRQLPLVGLVDTFQFGTSPGAATGQSETAMRADLRLVSRDYMRVMGIEVVSGRHFRESDGPGPARALLVNEALAGSYFPANDALGRIVYVSRDNVPWEIVGIVRDVRQFTLDRNPSPQMFVDVRQWPDGGLPLFPGGAYYALRTTGDAAGVVAQIRNIVREADPEASVFSVAPMEQLVASTIARPRMYAVLTGLFAGVGVALAVIGIYGLMAYSVAQRTNEIGVRIALGARRAAVMGLVLRHSMLMTAIGIAAGLAGAAALTRYLEGMLFGITPADTVTFVAVAGLFAIVAAAATCVPAKRAMDIDPLTALRYE